MQRIDRRAFLSATAAAAIAGPALAQEAPLGFTPDPKFVAQARALLARVPAIDLHAHPGITFARDAVGLTPEAQAIVASGPFEQKAVADMKAGGLAGGSFAAVADIQILGAKGAGLGSVREFKPGEAQASYQTQIKNLNAWVRRAGAEVAKSPDDIRRLHAAKKIAALMMVEGGDFLEQDVGNVARAYVDGVRGITLVHYHPNQLGDIQTAPARQGLTAFGVGVVAEMDRHGMLIDIAHADEATGRSMINASANPVICSHTALSMPGAETPRFISDAYARDIAEAGGVIGAWPSGFNATTLNDFIERILRLAQVAGPKAVALGTDMDANYKPVMSSYRQLPLVVSELLRRDYGVANTEAFVGGNFLRVWDQVWSGRRV